MQIELDQRISAVKFRKVDVLFAGGLAFQDDIGSVINGTATAVFQLELSLQWEEHSSRFVLSIRLTFWS